VMWNNSPAEPAVAVSAGRLLYASSQPSVNCIIPMSPSLEGQRTIPEEEIINPKHEIPMTKTGDCHALSV
jgi:hypothetical protein